MIFASIYPMNPTLKFWLKILIIVGFEKITLKSRKSKNHELDRTNLPQNSNFGREFAQKSGVQIPVGEGQIFLSLFLFIFIFSIKNWISKHKLAFLYIKWLHRYEIKFVQYTYFYWYLSGKRIKEHFMFQYSFFYGEYENEKKKEQKNLTFPDGDLNPGFLNPGFLSKFPPKIWILREISSIELGFLRISWL